MRGRVLCCGCIAHGCVTPWGLSLHGDGGRRGLGVLERVETDDAAGAWLGSAAGVGPQEL